MKKRTLQGSASTDYLTMPESELREMWNQWYPQGSGPIATMRHVCNLIEAVAMLRGFDVSKWCD